MKYWTVRGAKEGSALLEDFLDEGYEPFAVENGFIYVKKAVDVPKGMHPAAARYSENRGELDEVRDEPTERQPRGRGGKPASAKGQAKH